MKHTQSFPVLEIERLSLRAVMPADHDFYHALLLLPDVTRFSDIPDAPTRAQSSRGVDVEVVYQRQGFRLVYRGTQSGCACRAIRIV